MPSTIVTKVDKYECPIAMNFNIILDENKL